MIKIICFSKKSRKEIEEIENEYLKRIKSFCSIELKILKPIPITSCNNEEEVMKKEAGILIKHLDSSYLIVLERTGKEMSSLVFSEKIKELKDNGEKTTFVIGGAYGLDTSVIKKADFCISMSKLTYTHEMARILLLEQIYRSWTIIKGKKYHY